MKINQVNFSYNQLEDRLLFRLNTPDKTEFRMWLTRAMSFRLLDQLNHVVRTALLREKPGLAAINVDVLAEFRREAVLARADYMQSFSAEAEKFPLGAQPLLVSDVVIDASRPVSVVTFRLAGGQEVNLSLNHDLGVAISKLLSGVMDGLDWGTGMAKELTVAGAGNAGEKMMLH